MDWEPGAVGALQNQLSPPGHPVTLKKVLQKAGGSDDFDPITGFLDHFGWLRLGCLVGLSTGRNLASSTLKA